ncbi:hypothetical protein AB6A40_006025 [Gnathostoma spinigerum]|uniref:SCP domain-containing protein n=1 Tax=Gnathostoma spinigerum TaxID=75299 RepID=A0ABD6EPG3_9BILA
MSSGHILLLLLLVRASFCFILDGRIVKLTSSESDKQDTFKGSIVETQSIKNGQFHSDLIIDFLLSEEPANEYMKVLLVEKHNKYRRKVRATNMKMMRWSEGLAISAQRHANACDFRHSKGRRNVGENIWAAPYSNYTEAVRLWFEEVSKPQCRCDDAFNYCCGHYLQVVWSKTDKVGCGYARCRDIWGIKYSTYRHIFVCHYNPRGNTIIFNGAGLVFRVPAFKRATNTSDQCSECPAEAPACEDGLCYDPFFK